MTFLSLPYALFLLSVLGIYWSVQHSWLRMWALLIASLLFYASWQVQYVPLLLVVVLLNFLLGQAIGAPPDWRIEDWQFAQQDWSRRRWRLLCLGIVLNVLLLLSFKYIPFFLSLFGISLPETIGNNTQGLGLALLAPLGLSFFCFECIAYLVDVYRGAPAAQQFLRFAAYKLFFAKLINGPITRYHTWANQVQTLKFPQAEQLTEGLWLIASGAVKKGLLADNLGVWVDVCLRDLQRAGSGDLWLAILGYGLQLYLDFSGYVDIARGSALLLGFNLPQNFDFPYLSTSIADFWRRWHITLGDWLRNYLYFPLGGSRRGLIRTCFNLILVMLVAGFWHGAAWGYIVWGGLHGLALAVHRLTDMLSRRLSWLEKAWQTLPGVVLAWALTQAMVFTSWVFFRLPNLKDASLVVQRLWGHTADAQFAQKVYGEALGLEPMHLVLLLTGLMLLMGLAYLFQRGLKVQLNWPVKLLLVPVSLYLVWLLAPEGGLPYIYFDF